MSDSSGGDGAGYALAGASLLAGLISSAGAYYANKKNLEYQKKANQQMLAAANTAHQREVADLSAAGLNPILSASSSGAGVPQLTAADFSNPGEGLSRGIHSAVSNYLQNRSTVSQVAVNTATAKNLVEQNKNLQAQNREINARIRNTDADTALKKVETDVAPYRGIITRELPGFSKAASDLVDQVSTSARSFKDLVRSTFKSDTRAGVPSAPVRDSKPPVRVYTDEKGNVVKPKRFKRPRRSLF